MTAKHADRGTHLPRHEARHITARIQAEGVQWDTKRPIPLRADGAWPIEVTE